MTHLYLPLHLTVNGSAKSIFRRKFTEWYSGQLTVNLDNGKNLEDIRLQLTILKPLHASWILEFYNFMTERGKEIISNGWKASGITKALELGAT